MAIPSSRCTLLLLLVTIAASFPQFSTTSVFALAADASDSAAETEECKDKEWVGKIKKKGEKYQICEWVGLKKTKKRCKQIIKQRGMRKNKNGEKKNVVIEVKPWSYCGCTCADYQPEEEDTVADEKICPEEIVESNEVRSATEQRRSSTIEGGDFVNRSFFVDSVSSNCIDDGYVKNRECGYDWIWTGCKYEELKCEPKVECTCGPDFVSNGKDWKCKVISYPQCDEPPRPAPGEPIPPNLIPAEAGKFCKEGDIPPKAQQGSSILGI